MRPQYNYGPYYLMHGDLLPSNILVDSGKNIVAIIDWEYCSVVPAQLLVPPAWITGYDITQVGCGYGIVALAAGIGAMQLEMTGELGEITKNPYSNPFSKLWIKSLKMGSFLVAHAVLRPDKCITIYAASLDRNRYGRDARKARLAAFYSGYNVRSKRQIVAKKVADWESFKKEVEELGMELKDLADPVQVTATPELRKNFESDDTARARVARFFGRLRGQPWYVNAIPVPSGALTNQARHCAAGL